MTLNEVKEKLGYLILNKIPYLIIKYKDGWVAVDEHSGEKGDLAIHKGEIVKVTDDNHMLSSYGYKKIIAQSPNLSLEGVMKVEIDENYIEKIAHESLGENTEYGNKNAPIGSSQRSYYETEVKGFIAGYKAAQSNFSLLQWRRNFDSLQ